MKGRPALPGFNNLFDRHRITPIPELFMTKQKLNSKIRFALESGVFFKNVIYALLKKGI